MVRMTLGPQFDQPAGRALRGMDDALDRGQAHVFRILWFMVPPTSIARDISFQALLASRFLSDIALQALLYATLIATAREGGSSFDAALIGVAFLLPGVVLGLFGGAVADALPKRVALAGAYVVMGVLCFTIPVWIGTDLRAMLLVIFAVRALHQVSQPSEASAVPLVARDEELASANSFLSLASSAGEVIGKALLAPLVVRAWGVNPVTIFAGILFLLSATRVFDFRPVHRSALDEELRLDELGRELPPEPAAGEHPRRRSTREAVRWLLAEPGAFWMLMLAAMASTVGVVLGVLGPVYVQKALNVDPANAFYVFAPASVGLIVALLFAPLMIKILRERLTAILGFIIVAGAMAALGLIDQVTERASGLTLDIPGVGTKVETAAQISVFLGFGMTIAAAATQTYIGKYVPDEIHGRIFALLGTFKDGLAIPPLLAIGAVAGLVGVEATITFAPVALLILALLVSRYSARWRARPSNAPIVDRV
jgi:MFS family permease